MVTERDSTQSMLQRFDMVILLTFMLHCNSLPLPQSYSARRVNVTPLICTQCILHRGVWLPTHWTKHGDDE